VKPKLDEFAAAARNRPDAGGFLIDFDGTLSEIVADPDLAKPIDGAKQVLEALASAYRTVILITGRRATQLSSLVEAKGVHYLGLYGAEELIRTEVVQNAEAARWRSAASQLAQDAESFITVKALAGCKVEFKDLAVSIHYRAAPNAGPTLLNWASEAAPRQEFEANLGRMVVELRPKKVSKSNALRRIVTEQNLQWIVAAGDDQADIEMMQSARQILGNNSLCIGIESTEAPIEMKNVTDLQLESPKKLIELLTLFAP
jgi:trehalose 6-phosphate phosphatase